MPPPWSWSVLFHLVHRANQNRLSIKELLHLFGDVEEDEDGQPFILVEDKETLLNPAADSDNEEMLDEA
jgi:hypothetical protein